MTRTIISTIFQLLLLVNLLTPLNLIASEVPLEVYFLKDNLKAVVASGGENARAVVFNPDTGETLRQFSLGEETVSAIAVTVQKNLLACSSTPGEIVIYNLSTGSPKRHLKTPLGTITALSFSPKGEELAAIVDEKIIVLYRFDGTSDSKQLTLSSSTPPTTLFYGESYNQNFYSIITEDLFVGFQDGTFAVYDIYNLNQKGSYKPLDQPVSKGMYIYSQTIRRAPRIHPLRTPAPPYEYSFVILSSQWGDLALIDSQTGSIRRRFAGHNATISAMDFTKEGTLIGTGADNGTIKLWSAKTGTFLGDMLGHTNAIKSIGFTSTGRKLLSASTDGTVRLWDVASKTELASYIFEIE